MRLRQEGVPVRVLIRSEKNADYFKRIKAETAFGDITDAKAVDKAVEGAEIVVHLAALVNSADRKKFQEVNVDGTKNLLDASKKYGVKRFVFFSSAVITSKIKGIYSDSKIKGEKLVRDSGVPYTIVRPSLLYGDNDVKNFGGMIKLIKKLPIVPTVGSGNAKTQPVYIGDVVDAVVSVIGSQKAKNNEYFIAGPETLTLNEMIGITSKKLGVKRLKFHVPIILARPVVFFYERLAKNPSIITEQIKRMNEDKVYDITDAEKDFGYKPMKFEKGLSIFLR
jgi:NADH dehydrogenase